MLMWQQLRLSSVNVTFLSNNRAQDFKHSLAELSKLFKQGKNEFGSKLTAESRIAWFKSVEQKRQMLQLDARKQAPVLGSLKHGQV